MCKVLLQPLTPWHYFLRQIPHTFAAANSLHTARLCTTQKAKSFFLHLTLFSYFVLIINKLRSVRWFQNILHYPTPHLTLSYTTSYTILHCILHYPTLHLTLSYTASYTHICHSINTSSGDGHAATAIRNAGIGGAESMMLRLIFLPPVGVQPFSRNAFSHLHGIWCASGV